MYLCHMEQDKTLRVGMAVKVIHDTLKARIVLVRGNRVTVECEDGFHYEFDRSELIPVKDWEPQLASAAEVLQLA